MTHSLCIIQQPTQMDAEYMNSSWSIYSIYTDGFQ